MGISLDLGAEGLLDQELSVLAGARTAVATGRDLLLEDDGDRLLVRLGAMLDEAEHMARSLEALLISGSLDGRLPVERLVAIWVRAAAFQTCFAKAALSSAQQRGDEPQITRYRAELAEAQDDRRTAEQWVKHVAHTVSEEAWLEIFERARALPRRLRNQVAEIDEVISLCRTYIRRKKRASGELTAAPRQPTSRDVVEAPRRPVRRSLQIEPKRPPAVEVVRERRVRDERDDATPVRAKRKSNPRLEPLVTPKSLPVVLPPKAEFRDAVDPLADELFAALTAGPQATATLLAAVGSKIDNEVLNQFLFRHGPTEPAALPMFVNVMCMLATLMRQKLRNRARGSELAYQLLSEIRRRNPGANNFALDLALGEALLDRPATSRSEDAERAYGLVEPWLNDLRAGRHVRLLLVAAKATLLRPGDRGEQVERAIALTERVIELATAEPHPQELAQAHLLRGDALRDRGRGKRGENLEAALSSYREVTSKVRAENEAESPEQLGVWARCKLGLGICYALRQTGDARDNQLRGIECLNKALETLDDVSARYELALGRLHLARLLQRRGQDTDTVRIGELYEQAARVFTMRDHPNEYQLCHDGIEQLRRPRPR